MKHPFEEFLMEEHGKQCNLPGDMWPDDYANWLQNLDIDEWIELGDKFAKQSHEKLVEALESQQNWLEQEIGEWLPVDLSQCTTQMASMKVQLNGLQQALSQGE